MPPSALLNLSHGQRNNGSKPGNISEAPAQNAYDDTSVNRSQGQQIQPGRSGYRDNRGGNNEGNTGRGSYRATGQRQYSWPVNKVGILFFKSVVFSLDLQFFCPHYWGNSD
ncbi:hypothetical protein DPMN_153984 [Dreissena polymorpha]|uniref:Uncharacterized protein n=1 Tax=Dreissena polymorpha TaxID=45954 RepID=A0A9D4FP35_DREPO|nr:hypothetical protein DPMN_153984 [Dreissena polymorpha]